MTWFIQYGHGFCAIGDHQEKTCPGDSGGPAIWEDPYDRNRSYLIGRAFLKKVAPKNSYPK